MRTSAGLIFACLLGLGGAERLLRGADVFDGSNATVTTPNAFDGSNATVTTSNATVTTPSATAAGSLAKWYTVDKGQGQSPQNVKDEDGKLTLTVKPYEEAVRVTSVKAYKGGKFQVLVKSAAILPGIITSIYLSSGGGRKDDQTLGKQDEIDLEWKGNTPDKVQTNVFLTGVEDLMLVPVGGNSSEVERLYGVEWNDQQVAFSVNGDVVRTKPLNRTLAPMNLQLAVWTTIGGWPGLITWAGGPPDWNGRSGSPASATFKIVQMPDESV